MNKLASRKRCSELLAQLSRELEDGIKDGKYTQPGSYQNFLADQQAVMEQYRKTPGKGVMVGKDRGCQIQILKACFSV